MRKKKHLAECSKTQKKEKKERKNEERKKNGQLGWRTGDIEASGAVSQPEGALE